jgi:D-psicose/D-tagatose/L-ribulose 3-epimerase
MPWPEVFGALSQIKYQGAIVMEPFLRPGGEVGRDISVFRDLLGDGDLDEQVTRSAEFVRSELRKFARLTFTTTHESGGSSRFVRF